MKVKDIRAAIANLPEEMDIALEFNERALDARDERSIAKNRENTDPDEPTFVLLGRDPLAGALVRLRAQMGQDAGEDKTKIAEAFAYADALDTWAKKKGKRPTAITFRPEDIVGTIVSPGRLRKTE